jgi:hypothetical protein
MTNDYCDAFKQITASDSPFASVVVCCVYGYALLSPFAIDSSTIDPSIDRSAHVKGVLTVVAGLTRRRTAESTLFKSTATSPCMSTGTVLKSAAPAPVPVAAAAAAAAANCMSTAGLNMVKSFEGFYAKGMSHCRTVALSRSDVGRSFCVSHRLFLHALSRSVLDTYRVQRCCGYPNDWLWYFMF